MDKLTLIRALLSEEKTNNMTEMPFEIGKSYFVRTVIYHLLGRLVAVKGNFLVFEDGAWIADSGRFNEMLKTGEADEVEPVEDIIINTASIVDAFIWKHKLLREVK